MTSSKWPALYVPTILVALGLQGCVYITEADLESFYDRDNDGVLYLQDCDDDNNLVTTTSRYYLDADGDGFGDAEAQPVELCADEAEANQVLDNTDCDDTIATAFPGGIEVCDNLNIDEDCNGAADDDDNAAEGKVAWYIDSDGDNFGDEDDDGALACDPPSGTEVLDNTDCDDVAAGVNPGAQEVCDPDDVDEDCDGNADDSDGDVQGLIDWYLDGDGDGYGLFSDGILESQCAQPPDRAQIVGPDDDCDDGDADVNPGAVEVCDDLDVDEDCSGQADDDDPNATGTFDWYVDADGDDFGDEDDSGTPACDPPTGTEVLENTDCDDTLAHVNPDGTEVCDPDDNDEDCDGLVEDADIAIGLLPIWYIDLDDDDFGDENDVGFASCDAPALSSNENSDCDDGDDTVNPGELERHDGLDKNCDGFDFVCGESMVRVYPTGVADADYTTIQAAVDDFDQVLLCDGDIIEVTPGTYFENLSVVDVDPIIRGVVGPSATFVDGGGVGRTVNLERFSGTLEGFTIVGGNASVEVQKQGGGVRLYYGDGAVLNNLVVDGNSADDGGGIEVRHPTDVTLSDLTILNNSATGITGNGGGIRVSTTGGQSSGYLLMTGLQVETNDANNKGGGVYVEFEVGSPAAVSLEDSTFTTNNANLAGGLYVTDTAVFDLFRTDFIGNVGTNNFGAIQMERTGASLEDVLLSGNEGSTSAAMQISEYIYGPVTLNRVQAEGNTLTGVSGIGYAVDLKGDFQDGTVLKQVEVTGTSRALLGIFGGGLNVTGTLDAKNLLVYDNSGATGMYIAEESVFPATSQAGTHLIENSTFVGNDGDGLQVGNTIGTIHLRNVISAYNGGFGVNDLVRDPIVTYTNAWSNGLGTYANVVVPPGINGNIEEDPLFVAYSAATPSTAWDLQLDAGSLLIDAGDPDPFFNDPDGSAADMGYYGGPGAP